MAWKELKTFGEVAVGSYALKVKAVSTGGPVGKIDIRLHTPPREDGSTHTGKGVTISADVAKALVKILQAAVKDASVK